VNIQYYIITAAAQIESLGKMRRVHSLRNSAFIQLYVNELADTLHVMANLIMPSTASKFETILDVAIILLKVCTVNNERANKITAYMLH